MADTISRKTDQTLLNGLFATLGISMILPEYIAPFMLFGLYIYFKKHFTKTNRKALMGEVGKIFFAYMCYMFVSFIWSDTPILSALIALLWMGCFLGYCLVGNTLNTEEKLKQAIMAVNISAGVIGLIAITEFVTYNLTKHTDWFNFAFPNPFYYNINDFVFDLIPVEIVNKKYSSRASATFDNPLILATYLVFVAPFGAFGAVYLNNKKEKIISALCFVMSIGGIIATASRAAYVAIAVSLVIMLISSKKLFKKLLPFAAVIAVAVPVGLYLRYANTSLMNFSNSTNNRFKIWTYCFDMFKNNPIIGLGAGTDNVHTLLRDTYGIDRTHAHNLFLQMLVEGGVIGGLLMIAVIAVAAKNLFKLYKVSNKQYSHYAVLYASSIAGFFVMSMFEFTLQSPKELMTMFFVLGFSEATLRIAENKVQLADDEPLAYKIEEETNAELVNK